MIDIFGHFGYALILAGMMLVSAKNPYGWALRLVGEFVWLLIGVHMEMSSMVLWGLVFAALDVRTFYTWIREDRQSDAQDGEDSLPGPSAS